MTNEIYTGHRYAKVTKSQFNKSASYLGEITKLEEPKQGLYVSVENAADQKVEKGDTIIKSKFNRINGFSRGNSFYILTES